MAFRRIRTREVAAGAAALVAVAASALVAVTLAAGPAMAAGTGTGYLHTNGNKIVDSTGATVRLTGINWFGMETDNHTFHGLWAGKPVTWTQQLDHMAQLGFNTIRVPYTGDSLRSGAQATSVNTDTNPDLVGLSPLQILDKVINYAGSKGMRIILDRHRPTAAGQTALWYTGTASEASEISDWQTLATRYANNPTVIGADLFNEPHAEGTEPNGTGSCWGCGVTARDWRLAAERIGNAILQTNSNWLIFVEGVSCDGGGGSPNVWDGLPHDPMTCDWWGGNLSQAGTYPVRLNVANRLVYSAHDYGISVYDRQPWFNDSTFPNNLPAVWDHFWGYLYKQNIAPILVGEFGSTLANPLDTQWMTKLMSYMGTGVNGMSFTYWSWNPDSGDTGGIVGDDWNTVNQAKMNIIGPYLIPPTGSGGPTTTPPTSPTTTPPTSRPPTTPPPSSVPPTTTPPTTTPPTGGACTATYTITNQWTGSPGGFQASVTVKAGNAPISKWTVKWTFANGQTITQLWSGTVTTSGSAVTVTNMSYNGSIPANGTTDFGFTGTWNSTTNAVPTLTCTA
ncbi:cellulase family glycosylhydrolase [Dactylosporangium sp. NPDC048998]|uniref:cellulase family glycosylhydrolase n=1 Tax=Dactylosporangium sp. NPDC048998 TaxID=3363976 RepID=UPI0037230EBC